MAQATAVAEARPGARRRPGTLITLAIATAVVLSLTLAYVRGPIRRSIESFLSGFIPAPCYAGDRPSDPSPSAELREHRTKQFERTQAAAIALVVLFGSILGIGALAPGDTISKLGAAALATGVFGIGLFLVERWAGLLLIAAMAYPLADVLDRRHRVLDRIGLSILLSAGILALAVATAGRMELLGWEVLLLPLIAWGLHAPFLIAWQFLPAGGTRPL
jgi:hypothetical protein